MYSVPAEDNLTQYLVDNAGTVTDFCSTTGPLEGFMR